MISPVTFQVCLQEYSPLAPPDFLRFEPPLSMHTWRISRSLPLSCLSPENLVLLKFHSTYPTSHNDVSLIVSFSPSF